MATQSTDIIRDITASLKDRIEAFTPTVEAVDVGEVIELGDGIARCSGLSGVQSSELVEFANGTAGIAFNLEEDQLGVIILGEYAGIEEGQLVRRTGRIISVPVGRALLARGVDPLGRPAGMIPTGRGQRELIIGDRQTGKTAICIDAIINQKGKSMVCIYVAIGQKEAQVARTVATLEKYGAMDYTIVVDASASDPAGLRDLP